MKCPDDYNVILLTLPGDILACVRVNSDGYPTVYINDCLSAPAKRAALTHELAHFHAGDFTNHYTIYDVERKATYTARIATMFRAFRGVSEQEQVTMGVTGLALMAKAFGPVVCSDPIEIPEPLFDREPVPKVNIPKIVW